MKKKTKKKVNKKVENDSFLVSLWFNSIMSILAVVMLIKQVIDESYVLLVIWIVITFHFFKVTKDKMRK